MSTRQIETKAYKELTNCFDATVNIEVVSHTSEVVFLSVFFSRRSQTHKTPLRDDDKQL